MHGIKPKKHKNTADEEHRVRGTFSTLRRWVQNKNGRPRRTIITVLMCSLSSHVFSTVAWHKGSLPVAWAHDSDTFGSLLLKPREHGVEWRGWVGFSEKGRSEAEWEQGERIGNSDPLPLNWIEQGGSWDRALLLCLPFGTSYCHPFHPFQEETDPSPDALWATFHS